MWPPKRCLNCCKREKNHAVQAQTSTPPSRPVIRAACSSLPCRRWWGFQTVQQFWAKPPVLGRSWRTARPSSYLKPGLIQPKLLLCLRLTKPRCHPTPQQNSGFTLLSSLVRIQVTGLCKCCVAVPPLCITALCWCLASAIWFSFSFTV